MIFEYFNPNHLRGAVVVVVVVVVVVAVVVVDVVVVVVVVIVIKKTVMVGLLGVAIQVVVGHYDLYCYS